MDRVVLGPMFIGRSSVEPQDERAHRGAGEATAPVDPSLTVLVAYPTTSLSCRWTEDRPKAVRISGQSGEGTDVGSPSGDEETDTRPVDGPVTRGYSKEP